MKIRKRQIGTKGITFNGIYMKIQDVLRSAAMVKSGKATLFTYNDTKHVLIAGNCVNALAEMPDESVNLIITDPPYNMGLNYGRYYKDNLPWNKFYENSKIWLTQVSKVLAKNGSLYIITYPEIASRYLIYLEENCGLKLKRWLI